MSYAEVGPVCLFFNYLSCYEEGRYCEDAHDIVTRVRASSNERIRHMVESFEAAYRHPLLEEVISCSLPKTRGLSALRLSRAVQGRLFLCVAELIKDQCSVGSAAGYSIGHSIALHAASVYDVEDERFIHASCDQYIHDNWQHWIGNSLRSTFIYNPHDGDTNLKVKELLADYSTLVVKDDRAPYALQIVGEADEVADARRRFFEGNPRALDYSTGTIRSDAAHTSPSRYRDVVDVLASIRFRPARFDVFGHSGDHAVFGRDDQKAARQLFESIYAPLNMGQINEGLRLRETPVVLIGSKRVAQFAFYGLGDRLAPSTFYFWEDFLKHSFSAPSYRLAQDKAQWS